MNNAPYNTNKVTNEIKGTNSNNIKPSQRREQNPGYSITVVTKKDEREVITIDVTEPKRYRTGMEAVMSCVWINDRKTSTYIAGSGSAGGCGYHKPSAAISEAVRNAGIQMKDFGGCGDSTVTVAIQAIMRSLGYRKNQYIIVQR